MRRREGDSRRSTGGRRPHGTGEERKAEEEQLLFEQALLQQQEDLIDSQNMATRHVDFKTLGNQGGRWSFHQPVTETYVLSKISSQTPGPGYYADSDPAVGGVFKGRNVPFGKMRGGRRKAAAHLWSRREVVIGRPVYRGVEAAHWLCL